MPQILDLKGMSKDLQRDVLEEMSKRGLLELTQTEAKTSGSRFSINMDNKRMENWGGKFDKFKLKIKDASAKSSKATDALKSFKGKFNF